jgi:hypothetical protein
MRDRLFRPVTGATDEQLGFCCPAVFTVDGHQSGQPVTTAPFSLVIPGLWAPSRGLDVVDAIVTVRIRAPGQRWQTKTTSAETALVTC